jgi:hypothetical protein
MAGHYKNTAFIFGIALLLFGCRSTPKAGETNDGSVETGQPVNATEYQEFSHKFKARDLPFALPGDATTAKDTELDKKYIKAMLAADFMRAFGKEDEVPRITENIDDAKTKYFAGAKLKLDSFDGYIIHKQGDDDYYFLCLFDKQGKFTDGTWIAFTEGTNDDGTIREASINADGSIEISQYNVLKGKPDKGSAERHFYEITNKGKIRDLKENASQGNA